jgi:ABC-type phosphate transport system substrate-binding protein
MFKHTGYSGSLKLTPTTIAKIFSGAITDWNDADITADNGSAVPSKPIKVVYRSDSSGTSSGFTSYLRATAPSVWTKAGSSTFTSSAPSGAPAGSTSKSGSDGVTNHVAATDGSISYVELSYQLEASADGVKSAYVKNTSGAFVRPSSVSSAAAASAIPAANFNTTTGWIDPDYTSSVAGAYPITIFSFGIAKKGYSSANDVVKDFLNYSLTSCASAQAASLGYAQLTSTALTFAKARIALISSENRPVTATTIPATTSASVKLNKTVKASVLAKLKNLTIAKTSKVTMKVTSGTKNCKVVGTTVKGLKKGSCKVRVSVKTGTKTKTATASVVVS